MKKINIDKDFVDIIDYLDTNGFKPFASCDGVLANHEDPTKVTLAYISFLESDKILELMCAFLRDSTFSVCIGNSSTKKSYEYLGNIISGNRYSVYFYNKAGNITQYFEKIIEGVNENKISISDDELTLLSNINKVITNTDSSNLHFSISLNTNYQPYMNKRGLINKLVITNKSESPFHDSNISKDLNVLGDILSERFGITKKNVFLDSSSDGIKFITSRTDECEIYFKDDINQILDIISFSQQVESDLPDHEYAEFDYDEDYENYDEYDDLFNDDEIYDEAYEDDDFEL